MLFTTQQQKKKEETICYNYYEYLKKFGFEWENTAIDFKFSIKLPADEKNLIKKMTMSKEVRCKLHNDKSKMWNMDVTNVKRISYTMGYLEQDLHIKNMLNIRGTYKNLSTMRTGEKYRYLRNYSEYVAHRTTDYPNVFYSIFNKTDSFISRVRSNDSFF